MPVGTGQKVHDIIKKINPKLDFDVASNPEFLREGSAINDFMRPDRVVIGCKSEKAKNILKNCTVLFIFRNTNYFYSKRNG